MSAIEALAGVDVVEPLGSTVRIGTDDPDAVAPVVVRMLVEADASVIEVRVEHTSLEQIYFDVMGVRPGHDAAAD